MSETINSHPFTEEKEISFKRSSNTISGHFVIVPFGPKWKNQYQMRWPIYIHKQTNVKILEQLVEKHGFTLTRALRF